MANKQKIIFKTYLSENPITPITITNSSSLHWQKLTTTLLWQFSLRDSNFGLSFSMVPFPKKLCLSGNNCKSFPRKWKKVEQKLVLCALHHKNLEVFNSLVQITYMIFDLKLFSVIGRSQLLDTRL